MRRSDNGGSLRLVGKHRGSQAQPTVKVLLCLVELVRNGVAHRRGQDGMLRQVADEKTVTFFGRDPPG